MKGQLDNSGPSPEPGSYPMSLKIKLGVCFPPSLMAQKVFTDLRTRTEPCLCDYFIGCKVHEIMVTT